MTPELLKLAEDLLPHTTPFPESVRSVVADTVLSGGPATRVEVDVAFVDISEWWEKLPHTIPHTAERNPVANLYLALRYFMHAVQKVLWGVTPPPHDSTETARKCYNLYLEALNEETK